MDLKASLKNILTGSINVFINETKALIEREEDNIMGENSIKIFKDEDNYKEILDAIDKLADKNDNEPIKLNLKSDKNIQIEIDMF